MEHLIVTAWDENKSKIEAVLRQEVKNDEDDYREETYDYLELLTIFVREALPEYDHENIREIDDGHYQGTLVYIINETGYQPSSYFATSVSYGSCSGCDTLQSITMSDNVEQRIKDYMTLILHMVQNFVEIS